MAELEDLEQEELEKDLLEVGEPSNELATDPLEDLPAVRKFAALVYTLVTAGLPNLVGPGYEARLLPGYKDL